MTQELIMMATVIVVFIGGPLLIARWLKLQPHDDEVRGESGVHKVWDKIRRKQP